MAFSLPTCHRPVQQRSSRARLEAFTPPAPCQLQCRRKLPITRAVVPLSERDGWWTKDPQPNLVEADGVEQVIEILQANSDRLVLLDFFAPWCNACKSLYPKLNKMCERNPHILVVKVNFQENKELAKTLGVKVLPFFHAYHGSMGRVAAFSSSISKIQRLKDCIEIFGQPYCNVGSFDWQQSLPEFEDLSIPEDATRLDSSVDDDAGGEHRAGGDSESVKRAKEALV